MSTEVYTIELFLMTTMSVCSIERQLQYLLRQYEAQTEHYVLFN